MFKLLSTGNTKTLKGQRLGYMTFILHLAPADTAGVGNVCPKSTPGCRASCLNLSGHGGMLRNGTNRVQQARQRKTRYFFQDRPAFMADLAADIAKAVKYAEQRGFIPVFRLNGTSDIAWEKYKFNDGLNILQRFPTVQFYDYTKIPLRKIQDSANYHLTFSCAEDNEQDVIRAMAAGMNVAVVFDTVPETYYNIPVLNGDEHDLRFLDPDNSLIGLKVKGWRARADQTGFVIRIHNEV